MAKNEKGKSLGRGLGELLGEVADAYENEIRHTDAGSLEKIVMIDLDSIVANPYQPRKHFDEDSIAELSESIKRHGLIQPIVVIENDNGYMLIAGERRVRASRKAGLTTIKAVVADFDRSRFRELALIENIQRESLNPIELAHAYRELIEEHSITQDELAQIIHKSRSQIANTMRLLQLSDYVQECVAGGGLSQGHAKVLVGKSEAEQRLLCDTVLGQKLSVRETEKLIQKKKPAAEKPLPPGFDLSPYKAMIERMVPFNLSVKQGGRVEIRFSDEQQLKQFLKAFSQDMES